MSKIDSCMKLRKQTRKEIQKRRKFTIGVGFSNAAMGNEIDSVIFSK
jgi:hypothetical protein